jgi:PHD/YefM family antitoxin component YafN of YafNO toxin-antitoxin module
VVYSIPEDNWVSAEAEALLDATPGLREDLRAAMDELHAGTLQTVDAATARARIEASIKSRGSS